MAQMKHSKEPESKARLKRDQAFREALAKEYGVEKPPRSFQRMMAKTLEELPDAMPVRPRPVWTIVRRTAAAAAALAVTFAGLFGVNTTYPQLTEALPGLGPVFTAINGGRTETPQPEETPSPSPEPEFQPVTVLNKGDFPGTLTIDDAWSDGNKLVLDLSITPHDELNDQLGWFPNGGGNYDRELTLTPAVSIGGYDGGQISYNGFLEVICGGKIVASYSEGSFIPIFRPDDSGKFSVRWETQMDGLVEDELEVALIMPEILATMRFDGAESNTTWVASFETSFTVPVDTRKNRQFKLLASDNQVVLNAVNYTPSVVDVQLQLPYLGAASDLIFADSESRDMPLGIWAELTCMEGKYRYELWDVISPELAELDWDERPAERSEMHMRYTFTSQDEIGLPHPRELKGPLTLTLYELSEESERDGTLRRVMAEFTIDLNTGQVYPSERYKTEGRERMDSSQTASERISELMTGGILPYIPMYESEQGYFSFDIIQRADKEPHLLYVYGYIEDKPVQIMEVSAKSDGGDGTNFFYNNQVEIAGSQCLSTHVMLAYPGWAYDENGDPLSFDRVEIEDATDNVLLIEDVEEWCRQARLKILGGTASGTEAGSREAMSSTTNGDMQTDMG